MKNKKYIALQAYIESGKIKGFFEIFDIVSRTQVAKDTGINYVRLTDKIKNPIKFTVKDILSLSKLFGVDSKVIYSLIADQIEKKKK